jgi:hypothetical protein
LSPKSRSTFAAVQELSAFFVAAMPLTETLTESPAVTRTSVRSTSNAAPSAGETIVTTGPVRSMENVRVTVLVVL